MNAVAMAPDVFKQSSCFSVPRGEFTILPEVAEFYMALYIHLTCVISVPQRSLAQWALLPPFCEKHKELGEVRAPLNQRGHALGVSSGSVTLWVLVLSIVPCGGKYQRTLSS